MCSASRDPLASNQSYLRLSIWYGMTYHSEQIIVSNLVEDRETLPFSKGTMSQQLKNQAPLGPMGQRGLKRKLENEESQKAAKKRNLAEENASSMEPKNKTLDDFEKISSSDIERLLADATLLGSGTYGFAYKTTFHGKPAVLKVPTSKGKSAKMTFTEEATLLMQVDGAGGAPRLLALSEDSMAMVMELCPGLPYIDVLRKKTAPKRYMAAALPEIAKQLHEIHKKGIVHNDVKANNILFHMDQDEVVISIIDLGLSCAVSEFIRISHGGQSFYAPEYAEGAAASPAGDVYSLGFLVSKVAAYIRHNALKEVAKLALDPDPNNRPTMPQMHSLLNEAL